MNVSSAIRADRRARLTVCLVLAWLGVALAVAAGACMLL
jgi:hypothetical protein